jgi:ribosomal protein S21
MNKNYKDRCNVSVTVRGESKDDLIRALSEFNTKVKRSEIMNELKKYEHYKKPSVKRKWKRAESFKRKKREAAKMLKIQRLKD